MTHDKLVVGVPILENHWQVSLLLLSVFVQNGDREYIPVVQLSIQK